MNENFLLKIKSPEGNSYMNFSTKAVALETASALIIAKYNVEVFKRLDIDFLKYSENTKS